MKHRMLLRAVIVAMTSAASLAHGLGKDEARLEKTLRTHFSEDSSHVVQTTTPYSVREALFAINKLKNSPQAAPASCQEGKWVEFGGKYVLSLDGNSGNPCRIYDLSFPTVKTLFASNSVSKVPVQEFTATDYINWIDGDYESVFKKVETQRADKQTESHIKNSWVPQLKFKKGKNSFSNFSGPGSLSFPKSFRASDLEVGRFKFSDSERVLLQDIYSNTMSLQGNTETQEQAWLQLLNKPELFLEKVRFEWNDLEKVYDIFLEGEFIPLAGPVTLVDYNAQYKYAVESILRNVLGQALSRLTSLIPDLVVRNLVTIAVNDSFIFLDMLYAAQMAQLEDTLRSGLANEIQIAADRDHLENGLNILFGSQTSLFSEYILSLAQGQKFDWKKLDEIGRIARYREDKARSNTRARMNSALVLDRQCSIERINSYFAICSKQGEKNTLYSLMSEPQIFFWKTGAPLLHRYNLPAEIFLKRSTAWLLSAGLRMFDIPYVPNFIVNSFSDALKDYAKIGMLDESHLRNHLWLQKQTKGSLDQDSEQVFNWLYYQNINPFAPKSESLEQGIINRNRNLLGVQSVGPILMSQGAY